MMKVRASLLIVAFLAAGCGSSGDSGDTKEAAKDVQQMSSQGGAKPDPNLPKPLNGPPAKGGKGGKFGLSSPGG